MHPPLVCDEGDLEQGGDVQRANQERASEDIDLGEEEYEGGGKRAGQGEQQELH